MSKRPRRNHAPAFKARVALDALKGEETLVELSQRYQIHPNQMTEWKKQVPVSRPLSSSFFESIALLSQRRPLKT